METMGAEFGDNLLPAAAGINDKGFFEDRGVLTINIDLMKAAKAEWDSLAPIELDRIEKSELDRLRTRGIEILRDRCRSRIFALKDPRLSRLLPFWQPVFDALGIHVAYVVAIRNPISVTRSLEKRDGFPPEKTYLLWLNHVIPAMQGSRGKHRVIVDYDRLMEAPRRELQRISQQLELPLDDARADEFEQEFLESGLRHTRFEAQDMDIVRSAPRQVRECFGALQCAAANDGAELSATVESALADAQRYLDDVAPITEYVSRMEHLVARLREENASHKASSEDLQRALGECEARVQSANTTIEVLNGENRLNATISGMTATIDTMGTTINTMGTTIDTMGSTIRSLEDSANARVAALEEANRTIAGILQSTSWRLTAPIRALRRCLPMRRS
jgi:hypothetical protein